MKNKRPLKILLVIAGLVAIIIGGIILFQPDQLYISSGIELGDDPSIRNDIRAAGGAILACGMVILSGIFVVRLTFTATVISAVMYLSYGMSRIFSFAVDGLPVDSLVMAAVLEIIIGMASVFAILKYRHDG